MKKILGIIIISVTVLLLTGCSLFEKNESGIRGNCSVFDCIKKIEITDNLKTINQVMGFEGTLEKEEKDYKIYRWVTNEKKNESIQAVFYAKNTSISITFTDKDIKDKNVDFSQYEEIKRMLNNRETIKYKDISAKFNAEGVLTEKTAYSDKYRWVNKDGQYINATFSNGSGACTMIFGKV